MTRSSLRCRLPSSRVCGPVDVSLGQPRVTGQEWRIFALDTGSSVLDRSMLTYGRAFGERVQIPRVIWVLRGPTTVVVDTSVPTHGRAAEFVGESFERANYQLPAHALRAAGVDPKDVEYVLLTHLHWDHAGNCGLFPHARVIVQKAELAYAIAPGRYFGKSFLSPLAGWDQPPYLVPNLECVEGQAPIAPGVDVVPAMGHTPGSQAVLVETALGLVGIAGDAICTYENLRLDVPPGFHVNVDASVETMDRLRVATDVLLPSHDYAVFTDGPITEISAIHAELGSDHPRIRDVTGVADAGTGPIASK